MPKMTDDQKDEAIALRSDGMPYLKIAAKVGCSESAAFKFLSGLSIPVAPKGPKVAPKGPPQKPPALLLPREIHHGSCPTRKPIDSFFRNGPQLTKPEIHAMLAEAVRNTH